ncbi:MAG: glycosyltransferase family 2 protein [Rhodospirillaceae bacterium]
MSQQNPNIFSIVIPTYNRPLYIQSLLQNISEDFSAITFGWEIIIGDNSDNSETEKIVKTFSEKLPVVYHKHSCNLGPAKNLAFCVKKATGLYSVYLADDDRLDGPMLLEHIRYLIENPIYAAVYAPWKIKNLKNLEEREQQFYYQDQNISVKKNFYHDLIDTISSYQIFPEICIVKSSIYKLAAELFCALDTPITFFHFKLCSDLLRFGNILFAKDPFYVSVTQHPHEEQRREQLGLSQTEIGWDMYRGGLEYLTGLARSSLTPERLSKIEKNCNHIVNQRMLVALRLRLHKPYGYQESYFLAARLRGLGLESKLPLNFATIRDLAILELIAKIIPEENENRRIITFGSFDQKILNKLAQISNLPLVKYVDNLPLEKSDLIFCKSDTDASLLPAAASDCVVINEAHLILLMP